MTTTINLLLIVLSIVTLSGCHGNRQESAVRDHTPLDTGSIKSVKSMHEDFAVLWSAIKEMHPGYGLYTTTDSLQKAYDKAYDAIRQPLTESEFMDVIYPFLCSLRCGHTQIEHSENYTPPRTSAAGHLPFKVLVRNHRVWITFHQTDQVNTGDEILSLNDVPVETIIHNGYDLYAGDGYNESFKDLFLSEYDGFEDVCHKYYHWEEPYRLKIRTDHEVKSVQVIAKSNSPVTLSDKRIDSYADWIIDESIPDSRMRFQKNSGIALFKSPTFAYEDTTVFKQAFKLIHQKQVKTLILDMRHNSGGDLRIATQLLSYLADRPFEIIKDVKSRLPNPAINTFDKYFDASITDGFVLGFEPGYQEGAWYHIEPKPAFGKLYGPFLLNKADHFTGKLLVLIDGATFSSAALFTAALKAQREDVTFVGRETAGNEEGCNGVTVQKLTLPNTKVVVGFPWMRVVSVAKKSIVGRGLIPDYLVDYSPADIVSQKDVDLSKALAIIQ